MCLLFTGPSNAVRNTFLNTPGLIEDVYLYNSDGFGFMYAVTNKGEQSLKVVKKLPKSAHEVRKMFEALPNDDRMVAGHARMRTHGDINLDNCHPYPINESSWLMHNGILSTGNKKDTSKSDTWHFIEDFLKEAQPDTLHDPAMVKLLGEFIDNNRFAIMSADGRLSVVNMHQGLEHGDVWFSNTYAWTPALLIPGYRKYTGFSVYKGGKSQGAGHWYDEDLMEWPEGSGQYALGMSHAPDPVGEAYDDTEEAELIALIGECIESFDTYKLTDTFEVFGSRAVMCILENWMINVYKNFEPENFSELMCKTVEAWTAYDDEFLCDTLTGDTAAVLADALLFYCDLEYCGEYQYEDEQDMLDEVDQLRALRDMRTNASLVS